MSSSVRPRQGRISASRPCTRWASVVQLGRDVDGEVEAARRSALWVSSQSGIAADMLPPRPTNTFTSPRTAWLPARVTTLWPVLARRLEAEAVLQPVEELGRRHLGDADRAVALHVGMAAHRAQAGAVRRGRYCRAAAARLASCWTFCGAVAVLGDAHAEDEDGPLGLGVGGGRRSSMSAARQAGDRFDIRPLGGVEVGDQRLDADRVAADELPSRAPARDPRAGRGGRPRPAPSSCP